MSAKIIITHLRSVTRRPECYGAAHACRSSFMRNAPFLYNAKSTGGVAVIYSSSNLMYTVIIQL